MDAITGGAGPFSAPGAGRTGAALGRARRIAVQRRISSLVRQIARLEPRVARAQREQMRLSRLAAEYLVFGGEDGRREPGRLETLAAEADRSKADYRAGIDRLEALLNEKDLLERELREEAHGPSPSAPGGHAAH